MNTLHAPTQRIDRAVDKIIPEMRDLERAQDGSEISAHELETLTERAQNLGDRRDAFEKMRDLAAEGYRVETGEAWRPRHGSHTSRTGALTSAAIDARDFVRARKAKETQAHLPQGTLIAFAGGKDACDTTVIWHELDKAKAKYDDMVLAHGGGPGAERIAAKWAENRNVDQVVCRPDWNRHGKAAPFRRNDDLLNLIPKGLIAFPGSGITENLIDKARQKGFPGLSRRCIASASPPSIRVGPRFGEGSTPFYAVQLETRFAAGRFAPPPLALRYTPRVTRTSQSAHIRLGASRLRRSFMTSRHFIVPDHRDGSPFCERRITVSRQGASRLCLPRATRRDESPPYTFISDRHPSPASPLARRLP